MCDKLQYFYSTSEVWVFLQFHLWDQMQQLFTINLKLAHVRKWMLIKSTFVTLGHRYLILNCSFMLLDLLNLLTSSIMVYLQYLDGTTDITRTVHFGKPLEHEKSCYTAVSAIFLLQYFIGISEGWILLCNPAFV